MTSQLRTIIAYARLPHFVPIVAVLATTAFTALVISGNNLTLSALTRLLLAMLGAQIAIGIVNELVDAEQDAATKPDKPIPAGTVSTRGALLLGCAGLALMIVFGWTSGPRSFALLLTGAAAGIAYSLWFKQTRFAWLPYLVALPLLPNWVAVSVAQWTAALLLLFLLGAPGVIAVQLAQSVPDVAADRIAGLQTCTTRLGERRSMLLSWAALLATMAGFIFLGLLTRHREWWLFLAAILSLLVVLSDVLLYRFQPRTGVMAAFPCAVTAVSLLGIAWIAAVT